MVGKRENEARSVRAQAGAGAVARALHMYPHGEAFGGADTTHLGVAANVGQCLMPGACRLCRPVAESGTITCRAGARFGSRRDQSGLAAGR